MVRIHVKEDGSPDWEAGSCPNCGVKHGDAWDRWCDDCLDKQREKTKEVVIEVSQPEMEENLDIYSADVLANEGRVRGIYQRGNKYYIITGGRWAEDGTSIKLGHEVVPASRHDGPKYTYAECDRANGTGGYHHSNNMAFTYRGKEWVVVPYIEVIFRVTATQPKML